MSRFAIQSEIHFDNRTVRCYVNRPASVVDAFQAAVASAPGAEAIVDDGTRLSYSMLEIRSRQLATGLVAQGLGAGSRVALAMGNHAGFVVAMLAIWRVGAIAVPLNIREQASGMAYMLNDCSAQFLIADNDILDRLPERTDTPGLCAVFVSIGDEFRVNSSPEAETLCAHGNNGVEFADHVACEEDVAVLLYTSGTTGAPKGAMLTHFNMIHTALHYEHFWQLRAGDRALLAVPASHVTGVVALTVTTLTLPGCLIMMRNFDAEKFVALASEERMSWTILVPAMYKLCLLRTDLTREALKEWRVGGFGGAPMPAATISDIARCLPDLELLNAYGSTECASVVTATAPGDSESSSRSVGLAVPCCEVKIMDNGIEMGSGTAGEVWLRGPNTVPGYWGNPQKTTESFVDGFWRSGDVGMLDEHGYLLLFDRMDDVINRGGYKVYGVEVENLVTGLDGVVECAVIGIPDDVLGQKIKAFVVRDHAGVDDETVRTHCREQLADYKTPDDVQFVDEALPRNAYGKLLKRQLRQLNGNHSWTPPRC